MAEPKSEASPFPKRPVRRDTPSSSDTVLWLPVVKPRSILGPNEKTNRSPSDPAFLNAPSSRSPGSGVRRRDPEAGRYSIIAEGREKRRASG